MRLGFSCAVLFGLALTLLTAKAGAAGKTDPLTGLPLYPATASKFDPGNPMRVPDSKLCKCKQETDFYTTHDAKVSAAVAWCTANLAGFRKSHGYAGSRSQDTFFNADGTLVVSITGSRNKEGED
ncbi:MAG: hypothetical protein ACRD5Z_14110, partial [Bryobacteraceae bacterium]